MGKRFMCAELDDSFNLGHRVVCDLWPPNIIEPEGPYDWREAARSAASYEGLELKESDLVDLKGYIAFKIKTSVFFKGKIFLDNIKSLPEEYVVIGTSDGYPLIACWEEDF